MTDSIQQAQLGGVRVAPDIPKDVFYGFRLDSKTGHLDIEVIANGNGVVRLPDPEMIDPLDYKQWLWTTNSLKFQFNPVNGHLEMTVL